MEKMSAELVKFSRAKGRVLGVGQGEKLPVLWHPEPPCPGLVPRVSSRAGGIQPLCPAQVLSAELPPRSEQRGAAEGGSGASWESWGCSA